MIEEIDEVDERLVMISRENIGKCAICNKNVDAKIYIRTGESDMESIYVCEKHVVQMYKDFEYAMKHYIQLKQSILKKNFEDEKKRIDDLSKELFDEEKEVNHSD